MRLQRKRDHIYHSLSLFEHESKAGFDDLHFMPVELPQENLSDIDLSTTIFGTHWNHPIYINALTGGSPETGKINSVLAEIAAHTGTAIAVGSQTIALENEYLARYFKIVREKYPKGYIFANVPAHISPELAMKAVEMVEASALQVHLNLAQEACMVEGDRDFCGYLENIAAYCAKCDVPVVVKGVGYGISSDTAKKVKDIGISGIDVGGRGGTNFVQIELNRSGRDVKLAEPWGITTVQSLIDCVTNLPEIPMLASGGVYSALHVVKSLSLGASAVGIAAPLLFYAVNKTAEDGKVYITSLLENCRMFMGMLGCRWIRQLRDIDILIRGSTLEFCELRNINPSTYANRRG